MCLAIYIASNKPLPLVEWNEKQPKFHVMAVTKEDGNIEKQFKNTNIAYAGSHEGCGCGFFKEGEEGQELNVRQANYDALGYYLSSLMLGGSEIEIFACWEGDQGEEADFREKISLKELAEPEFQFKEKAYYEIA